MKARIDVRYSAWLDLRFMRTANRMARKLKLETPYPRTLRRELIQRIYGW